MTSLIQFLNPSHYHPTVYALPPLGVGIITALLGVVVLIRERGSPVSRAFYSLTATLALWLLCYAGIFSARHPSIALGWIKLENAAVVFIPTMVYSFTLSVTGKFQAHKFFIFFSCIFSLIFLFLVLFTDQFVEGAYKYFWGYYSRYGRLSVLFLIFFFFMIISSLYLFWKEFHRSPAGIRRNRIKSFLLGFGVGSLASVDYLATYGMPVYPCGFVAVSFFVVFMAWGIWRYRLIDITPSFAAEQIIKTLADGLLVMDQEGIVCVANQVAVDWFSADGKLVGQPISKAGIEFFKKENLNKLFWSGVVQSREMNFRNPKGEKATLDISSSVLSDRQGKPLAVVCIAKDITLRKQSEEALRHSEKHYRLLAENVSDVIWTMDLNFKWTYVSPSIMGLTGFRAEEAIVRSLQETIAAASFQPAMKTFAEELALEPLSAKGIFRSRTLELEYTCKNSSTLWTEVRITVVRDQDGRPTEIVGITRDITERRKAEEALQASQRCYSDLVQVAADPIMNLDRLGIIKFMNPSAEAVLDYKAHELAGLHVDQLLAPESVAKALQEFTLVFLGWQRFSFELYMVRKDGKKLIFEANPRLIRQGPDDAILQIIFHSLTIQREGEAAA